MNFYYVYSLAVGKTSMIVEISRKKGRYYKRHIVMFLYFSIQWNVKLRMYLKYRFFYIIYYSTFYPFLESIGK